MNVSVKVRDLSTQAETLTEAEAAALGEETPAPIATPETIAEAVAV